MRIAFIGSCLTAQVVSEMLKLDPGHQLVADLAQVRLDCLHQQWVGNADLYPPGRLADVIGRELLQGGPKVNAYVLKWQRREVLQQFREKLKTVDWLILDNNYDLSAFTWTVEKGGQDWTLTNLRLRKEGLSGYVRNGLADLGSSKSVYQELFAYMRTLNPDLRIAFVEYPVAGFRKVGSTQRVERAMRSADIVASIKGISHLPMLDLRDEDLSEKGPHYFSPRVYEVLAKAAQQMLSGITVPAWLSNGVTFGQLSSWVGGQGHETVASARLAVQPPPADGNPYKNLPERQFWKPAVSDLFPLSINGLYDRKFAIERSHRVSTFGSCFAQHIGHRLRANGYKYLDREVAPPALPRSDWASHGFGIYSARYGNVYTSLQMLQLFQQAFGALKVDEVWEHGGRFYDPLRPNIFPGGFDSRASVLQERARHLAHVRSIFTESDLIVFTLGLTECWENVETGVVYPMAPGATVGRLDAGVHRFRNLRFAEINQHMTELLNGLHAVNPSARMLLTVSPVPLTATYENRHVLLSTSHSKSVLRAVAGELAETHTNVDYFPSYEIITSAPFRSMFFKPNLRSVCDEGVDFVMSHFFRIHGGASAPLDHSAESEDSADGEFCDEILLEVERKLTA